MAILELGPASEADFLRWTDAFFQGALDYAGIQGFAPVGAKALNLVAGTHLLKVGSSLGRGQGFLIFLRPLRFSLAVLHDDGAHGIGNLLARINRILQALEQFVPNENIQRVVVL